MKDKISISDIVLDESIYPRERIYRKRVSLFAENMRDGFSFDPIVIEHHPDKKGKYRILDGAHRWSASREVGDSDMPAVIKDLKGTNPLLYAATMAIGPRQLTDEESKNTARRAFQNNPALTSSEIGKAIGRSRRTVDSYLADLRAAANMELDLKVFRMNRLGIPQDRVAERLRVTRDIIRNHLGEMAALPKSPNSDLSRGFTVPQVAEKHGWAEPMVWSLALEGKDDLKRFRELGWGLRTWDLWSWGDCDKRFGDDWPGRIPAQLIAHILYFFTKQNDLVLDPMAGGGVTADTCLALGRRCWSFDMEDRPDTRPEIEPFFWDLKSRDWKSNIPASKDKPDLIIMDPPYFSKKAGEYEKESISGLTRQKYLEFIERFLTFMKKSSKKSTWLAFINADWRDFQNRPATDEKPENAILIREYIKILEKSGWEITHMIQSPMSSERFDAVVVSAMQKKRILGVTSRYVIISK